MLGLKQAWKQRPHRKPFGVAGMYAGEQRLGEIIGCLSTESAAHEARDRFIGIALAAGDNHLEGHAQLSAPREERRFRKCTGANRKAKKRPFGNCVKPTLAQDVCSARLDGRHEPVGEAELLAERNGRRLLHQERVGATVDHPAIETFRDDGAAETGACFEQANLKTQTLQLVRRRKSGNAASDDDGVENAVVHTSRFVVVEFVFTSLFHYVRREAL